MWSGSLFRQEMQKCFDNKDIQLLQDVISKMDPTVGSGGSGFRRLWVPEALGCGGSGFRRLWVPSRRLPVCWVIPVCCLMTEADGILIAAH